MYYLGVHMDIFVWTPLELWANLTTVACIFLAGRNSIHTWWVGIVACVLFGLLFYGVQLYADVLLQVFFVCTGLIGWYNWRNVGTKTTPITKINRKSLLLYVSLAVMFTLGYGSLLHVFTNAWAPWIDSAVLSFSILGQLLLMYRKVEAWPTWVAVNTISVPLYISRDLYLTAGLYAVFFIHAFWAWYNWNNEYKAQLKAELV